MIYELRKYVAVAGKEEELRERFVNGTLDLFKRLGILVVEFWQHTASAGELWYLVEWSSETDMATAWEAFRRNDEWLALKAATETNGPLTVSITSIPLSRVDFFHSDKRTEP